MTRTSDKNDRFARVTVQYDGASEKAVFLIRDGDRRPIPKTLLSYSSEELLKRQKWPSNEQLVIEIREWKLTEIGWV